MPSDDLPWETLGRWFAGELGAQEAESLARWVAGDPRRAAAVAALREAWMAAGAAGEGWDAAAALRRVQRAAGDEATVIARLGADQPAPQLRWRAWLRPALRAAAVLAVVTGGVLVISRPMGNGGRAGVAALEVTEYRTAYGERLSLRLSDSTQVSLAPGSVLRRPADYGRRARRLELEGEAYFIVTHDAARPFTVATSRLTAHDLGTRFVVKAYPEDTVGTVFVAEGEVAVQQRNERPVVLTRDQLARVDAAGHLVVRSGVMGESYLAWTEGRLVFSDTPLSEVEQALARWYGVDVRLASPELAQLHVSGVFGNQSIAEDLATIARALGLTVRRTGGSYELSRVRP